MIFIDNKLETISSLFEDKEIRSIWDSDKEEYFFSVIDVINVLTDSKNPNDYWYRLKIRMTEEEKSELSTKCRQLKMKAQDGKMRETDTLDTKGILRLIESVPSPKAEPFKLWLANLGSERIDEVFDPEIVVNRAVEYYRNKGYTDEWIKARLTGIVDRFKLTERDNMTDIEVALTNIGEIATRDIAREEKPQGLKENLDVAKRGGGVAKGAKDLYEKETKKSAISKSNSLNYKYIDEVKQIDNKEGEK